jgi:membrane associated rhomboid family serine protease
MFSENSQLKVRLFIYNMANIRGISDLRRRQEAQRERQRLIDGQDFPPRQFPLLGYGFELGTAEEARKESFGKMLKLLFCPYFTIYSFIFFITCVDVIMYTISVAYDYDTNNFLTPTISALDDLGAKDAYKLKNSHEVWRWLTPMLLHAEPSHLTFNLIMQIILGFRLEPTVGPWKTIFIYIGSGFGGVLFSSIVDPDDIAVGASTALFGILAAMISWIIINWSSLEGDPYRTVTLVWLFFILMFNFLIGLVSNI